MCPCGWYSTCFQSCNDAQIEVRRRALAYLPDKGRKLQQEYERDYQEDKEGDAR